MSDIPVLKPCPFCGEVPYVFADDEEDFDGECTIACDNMGCIAMVKVVAVSDEAAHRAWNTRPCPS